MSIFENFWVTGPIPKGGIVKFSVNNRYNGTAKRFLNNQRLKYPTLVKNKVSLRFVFLFPHLCKNGQSLFFFLGASFDSLLMKKFLKILRFYVICVSLCVERGGGVICAIFRFMDMLLWFFFTFCQQTIRVNYTSYVKTWIVRRLDGHISRGFQPFDTIIDGVHTHHRTGLTLAHA